MQEKLKVAKKRNIESRCRFGLHSTASLVLALNTKTLRTSKLPKLLRAFRRFTHSVFISDSAKSLFSFPPNLALGGKWGSSNLSQIDNEFRIFSHTPSVLSL